jgi:hypothetical protein
MKRSDLENEITYILDENVGDLAFPDISKLIVDKMKSIGLRLTYEEPWGKIIHLDKDDPEYNVRTIWVELEDEERYEREEE